MLEPIVKTIEVTHSQQMAFDIFVDINSWWPLDKRSMSMKNGGTAKSVSVYSKVRGQIVEHSNDGNEHLWGTIKELEPYDLFRMNFHMGLPPCDSVVELKFTALTDDTTKVVLTQSNWEAFGDMVEMMHGGYGSSWGLLFEDAYRAKCAAVR